MTEDQIKHMVNRFLAWRLPEPWHPDKGIIYERPNFAHPPADHDWPTGTNLFDATQAENMIRHMLEGLPKLDAVPEGHVRVRIPVHNGGDTMWGRRIFRIDFRASADGDLKDYIIEAQLPIVATIIADVPLPKEPPEIKGRVKTP